MSALTFRFEADREALDSFRERSGRFLFARRRDGGLAYLEQGTAQERRVEARTWLRCPEPGCRSPKITTVSRMPGGARDGFRHLVAPDGGHEPESMFHRQAKALVQRWAVDLDVVETAEQEVRVNGGERVADVMLRLRGGALLAVEIQYSALTVEDWLTRTASYRQLGIGVTWLWGHIGAQSPLVDKWRELARLQAKASLPVLWLNPSEEQVAWAWDLGGLEHPSVQPQPPKYAFGALDDLEVRPGGLYPPGFRNVVARRCEEVDEAEGKRAAEEERQRRARELRDAALDRFHARDDSPPGPRQRRHRPVKPSGPGNETCRRCGGALDPCLSSGFHVDPWCHMA